MRILIVDPGPNFSVMDVANGYHEAFQALGHRVERFNFGDVMTHHHRALIDKDEHEAAQLAGMDLRGACFDLWPDLVVIVSGFFVPPYAYQVMRARGLKVAVILTESPYEDDAQVGIASAADVVSVNDPTNLERFSNAIYLPHAHRPMHAPRPARKEMACDFCFVGTGYPSRIAFFEAVDFGGMDVKLAGNWQDLPDDSPLLAYIDGGREFCIENDDAIDLYASAQMSANIYRTEAQRPELSDGWAMGPREVELAASGTFFLTQARGENREVLPMVPTFDGPDDLGEKLAWWLAHPTERELIALQARDAVADRTFLNNAQKLLTHAGF